MFALPNGSPILITYFSLTFSLQSLSQNTQKLLFYNQLTWSLRRSWRSLICFVFLSSPNWSFSCSFFSVSSLNDLFCSAIFCAASCRRASSFATNCSLATSADYNDKALECRMYQTEEADPVLTATVNLK